MNYATPGLLSRLWFVIRCFFFTSAIPPFLSSAGVVISECDRILFGDTTMTVIVVHLKVETEK